MKNLGFILLAAVFNFPLLAQEKGLGIGVMVGEPTGLSAKIWTSEQTALDAGLAWSFSGIGYLQIHADMLWHREVFDIKSGKLPVYYGAGAKLLLASDLGLGLRIPVGMVYYFDQLPIDIFVELVPGIILLPGTTLDLDLAIGARYFL